MDYHVVEARYIRDPVAQLLASRVAIIVVVTR